MLLKFINRNPELNALEKRYESPDPEFFIIYGRRRIGKTELVKKFASDKKHFYFLAREEPIELEIERYNKKFAEKFNIYLEKTREFEDLFKQMLEKIDLREKFIFIIDEFPFWVSKYKPVVSEFQYLWDELLSKYNVFLILLGSSVSVMEHKILAYKSPLYGRRTGQLKILPLNLGHIRDFLPHYGIKDVFRVYGAVGGIPFYLKEFKDTVTFNKNIENTFFNKASILYEEAEILLREELREVNTYFNIMKAIDDGATKLNEISSKSRIDITNINKYLSTLMNLGFVKKEYSITQPPKSRNFLYRLNDNYFKFWLKYVYPYKEEIEEDVSTVLTVLERDYSTYMGGIFEDVCKMLLRNLQTPLFIEPGTKIGTWWHKDKEIDLVAMNEKNKDILFAECKWKEKVIAGNVLSQLKEKSRNLKWHNQERKEHFAIFARSFSEKSKDCLCFDLKDLERALQ
ncbi:MAG: ATP-binding protein [Theionarchaea archaeon]|nr:ATP-binding protein [Theionarchaea archaeon]